MNPHRPEPDNREVETLARLCRQFGAAPPQDVLMARKLLERAEQLAETRGTDKLEALQYLLTLLKQAKEEGAVSDSASIEASSSTGDSENLPNRQENR